MRWALGSMAAGLLAVAIAFSSFRVLGQAGVGLLLAFAAAMWVLHVNVRCPRCKLHVFGKPIGTHFRFAELPAAACLECGRSRAGVWPLQYLLRPEA